MFRPGTRYRWRDNRQAVIEVVDAGTLHLPTGRLAALDPSWGTSLPRWIRRGLPCPEPFTATVPPGHYPVTVSIARWDHSTDANLPAPLQRGAAAKLIVRDEPVVAWELALQPRWMATLRPDEIHGFGVDAGMGSFLDGAALEDASAVAALAHLGTDSEWDNLVDEIRTRQVVNLVLDHTSGLNMVVFDCGMGDGAYPTWIGRTAAAAPACFVADLALLSHSLGPITD
jgi:Protein of unknown function (DUF4241)